MSDLFYNKDVEKSQKGLTPGNTPQKKNTKR